VRAIIYRGELVAIATRARVHLAPEVAALLRGDPRLRFVAAMCLYSRDVDTDELAGPYRSEDAELYARCVLLPDEEFELHRREPDDRLAARFRVPVEQVRAKRNDIRTTAAHS
jgi:hypothetical protein